VLIPTVEEELELLVKCHREEFHEDVNNNVTTYSFMRDMLMNNCHITNFIKKIDYVQSICKQCRNGSPEENLGRPFDTVENELEIPGRDITIEMVNLRRAVPNLPCELEIVFLMDNFSRFFTI
jgi:hypothetical protein